MSHASGIWRYAHEAVFRWAHRSELVFNACWEDPAIDRRLLQLNADSRVVMLTSAGCNLLDYLLDGPAEIHSVDQNPAQTALAELKVRLTQHTDHQSLTQLFLTGYSPRYKEIFGHVMPRLSPATAAYWVRRQRWFSPRSRRGSFYYYGMSGTLAWACQWYMRTRQPHLYGQIQRWVDSGTLKEQQAVYAMISADILRCRLLRIAMHPIALGLIGVPPSQVNRLAQCMPQQRRLYAERVLHHIAHTIPAHSNYIWRLALTGAYTPVCCPAYLRPESFEPLHACADRITLHTMTLTEFLTRFPSRYTHFCLLDHMDWIPHQDTDALDTLWRAILNNSAPGTRIVFRTVGSQMPDLPACTDNRLRFRPDLSEPLHRSDRMGLYGGTYLCEVIR